MPGSLIVCVNRSGGALQRAVFIQLEWIG